MNNLSFEERHDKQVKNWVNGKSIHNYIDDECCPDFSCCRPELLTDQKTRNLFKELYDKKKDIGGLLMGFLGEMITKNSEKRTKIIGVDQGIA